mmetsp:Transcript_31659/g.50930  ORF Transcript_31659/g.50930 Transcript_31659/m.50930 type:complete len:113 (+) Transcript_31659:89-427(+)
MASEKAVFCCWTKFKGGKFKLQDDQSWNEYDKESKIVASYKQLDGDDYELKPYEVILLHEDSNKLIKLDKKYSRTAQIPADEKDVQLLELFKLKWDIIESGFWDSLDEDAQK